MNNPPPVAVPTDAAPDAPPAPAPAVSACVTVETGRLGPLCAPACATDADCKVSNGYVCDQAWHACLLPNTAALVAKQCPGSDKRDPAFSPSELTSPLEAPFVAQDATMLYTMEGDEDRGLRVRASRDHGATFGEPVTPLAGTYGNAVIDDTGALHIVALDGTPLGGYGSAMQKIEYAVSRDHGATFSSPLAISRDEEMLPTFFANPSIAVDSRRKWLYIAYLRGGRDAVWDLVITASHDAGKTWKRTVIGDGCAIHLVPNLALDPVTGSVHLVYYDNVGAIGRLVHATCNVGAAACSPWGAINSEPFAALPLGRNTALALSDRTRLTLDAKRRTLDVVWTQPVVVNATTVVRTFHSTATLR